MGYDFDNEYGFGKLNSGEKALGSSINGGKNSSDTTKNLSFGGLSSLVPSWANGKSSIDGYALNDNELRGIASSYDGLGGMKGTGMNFEDWKTAQGVTTPYDVFGEGNVFGAGGAMGSVLGLGNTVLQGLGMWDKHKMNKEAMKYAKTQNKIQKQQYAENKRVAQDKKDFDAGWNVGASNGS
jgi:hypothetical protein